MLIQKICSDRSIEQLKKPPNIIGTQKINEKENAKFIIYFIRWEFTIKIYLN